MKNLNRIIALLMTLLLLTVPALAEDDYYDDPPVSPDISLPSNPSTGYRWTFSSEDLDVIEIFENGFFTDSEGLLGAAGHETFRIYGYEEGMATVTFTYGRSWEEEPLYTLVVQLIVDANWNVSIFQMSLDIN